MDPALKAMLHDRLLIAPYVGQDGYGKPSYGPDVVTLGRIERNFQAVLGVTGRQTVEETLLYLAEDAVVNQRSRVTLPDGSQPPIEGIKAMQDEFGNLDHYVLYF